MGDVYKLHDGVLATLDAETGHAAHPAMTLRLFQSGPTISATTVIGDLTQATFTGYAAIAMPDPGASAISAGLAAVTYAEQSFTITAGSQNIGGWCLTNSANTKLYWAQNDAGDPVAMSSTGLNNLRYTITLEEKDSHV